MCFGGPSIPAAPAPPPPAPVEQEQAVRSSMDRERRRQAATQGQQSTVLTGSQGVTSAATTSQKTLLGA